MCPPPRNHLDKSEFVYSHKYYYDEANQLVREDFPGGDRTVVYAYDVGGNLRSRTWYQPTFGSLDNMEPTQVIEYGYGDGNWADRLTSYNGTSVDADEMGNITLFENTQLTWTAGRQLETTTYHGVTKRYYYNADGYIAKIVSTDASTGAQKEEIDYFWQDGKILALRQKDLRNDGDETVYEYLYDSDGELQAIESGAFRFMLEKNLLGDIIGVSLVNIAAPNQPLRLMDVDYDAYGEPELLGLREDPSIGFITIFYMAISPVLYRGYLAIPVGEHFCYYLGSRFYCPDLGRFLNADVYQDTQQGVVGANMFAYCSNNPVMMVDPEGKLETTAFAGMSIKTIIKIVLVATAVVYLYSVFTGNQISISAALSIVASYVAENAKIAVDEITNAVVSLLTAAQAASIRQDHEKIMEKVGKFKDENVEAYWTADLNNNGKSVKLGTIISFNQAIQRINIEYESVFASTESAARKLFDKTKKPGASSLYEIHPIAGGRFYYHFHPYSRGSFGEHVHIWFLR